jgi:hypothetical protein
MLRARMAILMLTIGALVISNLTDTRTAEAASTTWQAPLDGLARLATLPDGSVAALRISQGVTHVSSTGIVNWTKSDALVDQGPVADSDGNIYWTSDQCTPSCTSSRLVSVTESGAPRWTASIPFVISVPIKDGPDGLIYAAGGTTLTGGTTLIGVSKTDGHVVFSVDADWLGSDVDVLFPYPGGIAVIASNATYYSTAGAVTSRHKLADANTLISGTGTPQGVVYVVRKDCAQNGLTTLMSFTAAAQLWEKQLGVHPCAPGNDMPYVAALPDGGAVVRLAANSDFGSAAAYDSNGNMRWQTPVPSLQPPTA